MGLLRQPTSDITKGVIWKQLLAFFFPLWFGTFFQQLYNTVDTLVVGRFVGKVALAAVGSTTSLINLLIALFVGLSVGANVVVAMHVGAGEFHSIKKSVHTAMALSLIAGVVLGGAGLALAPWVLDAIGMPEDSLADALTYVRLYFCAIPFLTIYNCGPTAMRNGRCTPSLPPSW